MYLYQIMRKSADLNGVTRIRTISGDTLEGQFVDPNGFEGLIEFTLKKGGVVYLKGESIESVVLLDNLQILEEKVSE